MSKVKQLAHTLWKHRAYIILAGILVIGLLFRLNGIGAVNNVDEPNVLKRAERFAEGQWHITWYNWPAHTLIRGVGVLYWIYNAINTVVPLEQLVSKLVVARLLTVAFALATIWLVFIITRSISKTSTGLLAAWFLAISWLHVQNSQYSTPDVPMTCALMVNVWLALKLLHKPVQESATKLYFWAGIVTGFAVATKYTGAIVLLPIALVHIWRAYHNGDSWKERLRLLFWQSTIVWYVLGGLIGQFFCNPFIFGDLNLLVHDVLFEAKSDRLAFANDSAWHNWMGHMRDYLGGLLAWNGMIISIVGYCTGVYAIVRYRKKSWLPVALIALTVIIFISALSYHGLIWTRWAVPFVPFVVILSAIGFGNMYEWLQPKIQQPWIITSMSIVVIGSISLPQVVMNSLNQADIVNSTTGSEMTEYIEQNLPTGSIIAADSYYIKPDPTQYDMRQKQIYLYDTPVAKYQNNGVQYLIVRPERNEQAKKKLDNPKFSHIVTFFEDLKATGNLVHKVKPSTHDILSNRRDDRFYYVLFTKGWKPLVNIRKGGTFELYSIEPLEEQ